VRQSLGERNYFLRKT